MSIKTRLVFSYLVMLLIPVIMTIVIAHLAGDYYFNDLQKYGVGHSITTVKGALIERENQFSQIKNTLLQSPDKLLDTNYLKQLDEQLRNISSGIIVRKDNSVIYMSPKLEGFESDKYLPEFGRFVQDMPVSFKGGDNRLILSQQDFYFTNGSKGSVFLATDIHPLLSLFRRLSITVAVAVIVILVLINGVLTYIIARRIINPLRKLKDSANKIKEGDLDFDVDVESKDEIGELGLAFNEMRMRLKGSLELQHQYENNRRELLSNISHDLRTPITAIKGYVEGIRDGVAGSPEKMKRYINTIYSKAVDADRLIEELFLYSKLELSKLEFKFSEIDIVKYLEDCMEELQFDLEKRRVEIAFNSGGAEPLKVRADVQQLKRVIINIVENSVKYMDKEKGRIDIELNAEDGRVVIAFRDNGQGIPKEALPYIFDRFYRADSSRNTSTGGSGLGLSIADMIIKEHGGTMWAESAEGQGTAVFFTLEKTL
ncbi:MAG: HAMP domain-containing sensor histidine kinase [Bacillota bacterium]|nr:HAMP domain-containing sensor histidine kinase [Bacillota bacterium]